VRPECARKFFHLDLTSLFSLYFSLSPSLAPPLPVALYSRRRYPKCGPRSALRPSSFPWTSKTHPELHSENLDILFRVTIDPPDRPVPCMVYGEPIRAVKLCRGVGWLSGRVGADGNGSWCQTTRRRKTAGGTPQVYFCILKARYNCMAAKTHKYNSKKSLFIHLPPAPTVQPHFAKQNNGHHQYMCTERGMVRPYRFTCMQQPGATTAEPAHPR
jgi:hypothetical protein